MPSCSSCPGCMQPDEAQLKYGTNPGVAVCVSRGGKVISIPGEPEKSSQLQVQTASNCPYYGNDRPAVMPKRLELLVALPNPVVTPDGATVATNCRTCSYFMDAYSVKSAGLGFKLPMCRAFGRLLMDTTEAQTCSSNACRATEGAGAPDFPPVKLLPHLDPVVSITAMLAQKKLPDPTEYPTDQPVTADQLASGIRAWWKVTDPNMIGPDVFLPIFDRTFFDAPTQEIIPMTGDEYHPEWYIDHAGLTYKLAAEWMGLDETPVLIGHAGTGKTQAAYFMAWRMQLPAIRVSITRSSDLDDLFGKWLFVDGETRWVDGRITSWWEKPCVLLLDEPNVGPDEVWEAIRPMTEASGKRLVLDAAKGETRQRGGYTYFVMAINPPGPMYVGTREISAADNDRLSFHEVGLPPEDLERKIIIQYCEQDDYKPLPETVDVLMRIAADIRGGIEAGALPISWGIRPMIKVLRKTQFFSIQDSFLAAVGNNLEPVTRDQLMTYVHSIVCPS